MIIIGTIQFQVIRQRSEQMEKYSNPDVFIVLVGFIGIILLGALLGEVAVRIAKMLGYEYEE